MLQSFNPWKKLVGEDDPNPLFSKALGLDPNLSFNISFSSFFNSFLSSILGALSLSLSESRN